ncbi:hypothetical protein TREES_T100018613 [Tupaia chinensis]|uniref:Uncharacterized protein n=1 Tax=Tupaia chinensis TaxID=246437 RepID=L9KNH3_TUPCH|nr:hypothetical protein TREES_T100018613 [Tupaia chinensis]
MEDRSTEHQQEYFKPLASTVISSRSAGEVLVGNNLFQSSKQLEKIQKVSVLRDVSLVVMMIGIDRLEVGMFPGSALEGDMGVIPDIVICGHSTLFAAESMAL